MIIGGHTSEMISLIKGLNPQLYTPFVYVYANSDTKSMERVKDSKVYHFYIWFSNS